MDAKDFKVPTGLTKFLDGFASQKLGVQIDVTSAYRRQVLKDLPALLVFDDLERARMSGSELLSTLNSLAEHEGRNVVLIANEAELDRKDDFRRWREKVVGRTVSINASTDAALPTFLAAVKHDAARHFLREEVGILREVFDKSAAQNLRLLRQSILEFAEFFTQLPVDAVRRKSL